MNVAAHARKPDHLTAAGRTQNGGLNAHGGVEGRGFDPHGALLITWIHIADELVINGSPGLQNHLELSLESRRECSHVQHPLSSNMGHEAFRHLQSSQAQTGSLQNLPPPRWSSGTEPRRLWAAPQHGCSSWSEYSERPGGSDRGTVSTQTAPPADSHLEGLLHDLQDVGGVVLKQPDLSDGEIRFEFLQANSRNMEVQ